MTILTDFFYGKQTIPNGERLDQILRWMDYSWEKRHDFIQWVFPTDQPSQFSKDAPLVTQEDIEAFASDRKLHYQLIHNYMRFIRFLKLDLWINMDGDPILRKQDWIQDGNHNLLRITRCLRSLNLLGCPGLAADFLKQLENLAKCYPDELQKSLPWWRSALYSPRKDLKTDKEEYNAKTE